MFIFELKKADMGRIIIAEKILRIGVSWMALIFRGSVCSNLNDVKVFIQNALNRLTEIIVDEDLMFDIRLIINELIVNGVIHGNCCDISKNVYLLLDVEEDYVKIEVVDEGNGIDYDVSSYDPDELKCCGRGLVLVDRLCDEFYIDKNRVIAVKHL